MGGEERPSSLSKAIAYQLALGTHGVGFSFSLHLADACPTFPETSQSLTLNSPSRQNPQPFPWVSGSVFSRQKLPRKSMGARSNENPARTTGPAILAKGVHGTYFIFREVPPFFHSPRGHSESLWLFFSSWNRYGGHFLKYFLPTMPESLHPPALRKSLQFTRLIECTLILLSVHKKKRHSLRCHFFPSPSTLPPRYCWGSAPSQPVP